MSRPLHHRPAPTPAYLRIAAHLEREIAQGHMPVHTRLPAERALAETFAVNRQTVRAALQWLRQRGIVVTDRRGTYVNGSVPPVGAPPVERPGPAGADGAGPAFPMATADTGHEGRLFSAPVPPAVADALGILRTRPALTYHQRGVDASGRLTHESVTHFAPAAALEIPELGRYVTRLPVIDPDLRLLHHWLTRSGLRPTLTEAVTVTRPEPKSATPSSPELAIRRHLHDQRGRLLALTDVTFPSGWQRITLAHTGPCPLTHDIHPAPPTGPDDRADHDS
ncbi:GntR family transcriptional regulator [Streptomyces sp. NPDC047981]|uniref:GntR family transcriptional regulator n=1 Tax=Streptomyces sp. NPDC047981 TaxID=3154610 RepID=UPI0034332D8D